MRERTRHVLDCGISNCTSTQLQQAEVCNKDQNCIIYKIDYSQWDECSSNVSTTYCSSSVQTRNVTYMLGNTTMPIEECSGYSMESTARECKVNVLNVTGITDLVRKLVVVMVVDQSIIPYSGKKLMEFVMMSTVIEWKLYLSSAIMSKLCMG